MITEEFLEMLRCPESRMRLKRAEADFVKRLNQEIAAGRLRNRGGHALRKSIDGLLIREDNKVGYPIVDDIPILLVDEAIELSRLTGNDGKRA